MCMINRNSMLALPYGLVRSFLFVVEMVINQSINHISDQDSQFFSHTLLYFSHSVTLGTFVASALNAMT